MDFLECTFDLGKLAKRRAYSKEGKKLNTFMQVVEKNQSLSVYYGEMQS